MFGGGRARASALFVGEQPGDEEDRAGAPFVGPAGRLFDRALEEAGIDRQDVYVTNAVKHFKFTRAERGKRRIHKKPSQGQISACRPWLLAELNTVRPRLVVCLGATAAQSLLGSEFRVSRERGTVQEMPGGTGSANREGAPSDRESGSSGRESPDGDAGGGTQPLVVATVHPSSVLRAPDREQAFEALLADLRVAADVLSG